MARVNKPGDIHEAFYRVCHDYAGGESNGGGVPALARKLGMPPGTLYNKANPNEGSHHKPTLSESVVITNLADDARIAQAFCHSVGGVFYRLPDLSQKETDALLNHLLDMNVVSGDFCRKLQDTLQDDTVDRVEFYELQEHAEQWVATILECMARLAEMAGVQS